MERQKDLNIWLFERQGDLPLSTQQIHEKYCEERNLEISKQRVSNILVDLEDKGFVKQPESGTYGDKVLTDKGKTRADRIKNPGKYAGNEPDNYAEVVEELKFYIHEYREEKYNNCLNEYRDFNLKLSELEKFSPELVDFYEENPDSFFSALVNVQEEMDFPVDIYPVHDLERLNMSIPEVNDMEQVGKPVKVEGTVEYATEPHGYLTLGYFKCTNCGAEESKEQEEDSSLKSPYKCEACGSRKFETVDKEFRNVIEFRLSDATRENQKVKALYNPEDMETSVSDLRPGSRLEISGIVKEEQASNNSGKYKTYVDIHTYDKTDKTFDLEEVSSEKFNEVKNKVKDLDKDNSLEHPFFLLSRSVAPHVIDNDVVKQVVTASMLGASKEVRPEHVKHERIHSLIVGNPGTGKSDIVESALDLLPKSYVVDASNSSGVGLTATVEQEDGGNYSLRAGRLVQADRGYLGIDELDKIPDNDEAKLNTALDKGWFTMDKASQHAKLPGRATVIGVANYQEEIDQKLDVKSFKPEWQGSFKDRFALEYYMPPEKETGKKADGVLGLVKQEGVYFESDEIKLLISLARDCDPELSSEASELASKWYKGDIEIEDFSKFETLKTSSMRPLIHLIKVSCAFARARLSEIVEERDMRNAIRLFCDANRRA